MRNIKYNTGPLKLADVIKVVQLDEQDYEWIKLTDEAFEMLDPMTIPDGCMIKVVDGGKLFCTVARDGKMLIWNFIERLEAKNYPSLLELHRHALALRLASEQMAGDLILRNEVQMITPIRDAQGNQIGDENGEKLLMTDFASVNQSGDIDMQWSFKTGAEMRPEECLRLVRAALQRRQEEALQILADIEPQTDDEE